MRQAGSPADGSCAGGSGATGASTVVVVEPVTGTVEAVECTVVVEPPRVGDVEDNVLPGRPGLVAVALAVAFRDSGAAGVRIGSGRTDAPP